MTAVLATPPVVTGPLMFDGVLIAGMGYRLGRAHPSGWVSPEMVATHRLPLAQIEDRGLWWYACSQITPAGGEQGMHKHRRPPTDLYARFTTARTVNHSCGPDKALRIPGYYRPGMLELTWTCIGDRDEVADLLTGVPSIGKYATDGWGWVRRWHVEQVDAAEDYTDPRVRHVPFASVVAFPARYTQRLMALRPPYYVRLPHVVVPCIQVVA